MKKAFIFLILVLLLTVTALGEITIDNNPSYMGGYPDGSFRPDLPITRAEAVTVLARLSGKEIANNESSFADLRGHWSENYVAHFEKENFFFFKTEGLFRPDLPITRGEFVALAVNVFDVKESSEVSGFSDVSESHPFYSEIIKSAKSSLVGGYPDGSFRPDGTLTRAEAVTVINRALGIEASSNIFGQNFHKLKSFTDISGHWARYNILVASNENAGTYVTPVFGNIYIGGIYMKEYIVLENSYVAIKIGSDGTFESFFDKVGNKELLGELTPFAHLEKDGDLIYPEKAVLVDGRIKFVMEDGSAFSIIPTVKDAYISFEAADFSSSADTLVFADTILNYEIESDDDVSVLGISLSSLAITRNHPKITTRQYKATSRSYFGINGAKYAFVATPVRYHLSALEALANDTDIKEGIFAASRFNTEEKRLINTNYFLGFDGNHETVFNDIDLYTAVGIDMLSFHKGDGTFRQGDFHFHNQSLKTAYSSVLSAYIKDAGINKRDLFSYYMTPEGASLLHENHQKEFEYIGSYKLAEELKSSGREFALESCTLSGEYYVAIGDELIRADFENGKATSVTRRVGDTSRVTHQKGRNAVVIKITGTGAHNFKALVSDKLREKGILSGLHTYAFYIDPECEELLSDPYWQKQFDIGEEYTLSEDITESSTTLPTIESLENAERTIGFRSMVWDLVLIGEELIRINLESIGDKEFLYVTRGYMNTERTPHQKGEKVRRIAAYYSGLTPKMGSELFYHVAKLTGEAYRDGGFDMVYFDAIDGATKHVDEEKYPDSYDYYSTEFLRATLEYCEDKPITEVYNPTQYITHSYTPAYDFANRGYKEYIKAHSDFNQTYLNSYFFATLGWYNFYPQNEPANTFYEYQHTDDIDLLGCTAIAYDYSMVFSNLETYNEIPKNRANIDRFVEYDKLRKAGYFSEAIREQLRESEFEHSLVKNSDGSYSLVQKHYEKARIHDVSDKSFNFIEGENPFGKQTPFIRIEADWSSDGQDAVTLLEEVGTPKNMRVQFDEPFNSDSRHALTLSVTSNGKGGAICISLDSPVVSDRNQIDYVIPLDFEGTKDFTFVATDTFLYPMHYFPHWETRYTYDFKIYRGPLDFNALESASIDTYGDMAGVRVGEVKLAKHTNSPIVNPTLSLENGEKITFKCTINSGEYLEYDGKEAYIFDSVGKKRSVSEIEGKIEIDGNYKMSLTSEDSDITVRGKITVGFTGKELK